MSNIVASSAAATASAAAAAVVMTAEASLCTAAAAADAAAARVPTSCRGAFIDSARLPIDRAAGRTGARRSLLVGRRRALIDSIRASRAGSASPLSLL